METMANNARRAVADGPWTNSGFIVCLVLFGYAWGLQKQRPKGLFSGKQVAAMFVQHVQCPAATAGNTGQRVFGDNDR